MSNTIKTQWKKRVELTQFFYSCLIKDLKKEQIIQELLDYNFDSNQIKCINYFANNYQLMIKNVSLLLNINWTWQRLPIVLQAIIMTAICENNANNLNKAIVIDQALVTCSHYCQNENKSFLNAILDKLLK